MKSASNRHSLSNLSLTNHSQLLNSPLQAIPQSDELQLAARQLTVYDM